MPQQGMQVFSAFRGIDFIIVAAFGAILGSFYNMLIYRIPREISVISPGSTCPKCGHRLTWKENIPIVSYIFLKGRCAACSSRIPLRYIIVEIVTPLAFLLAYWRHGLNSTFFMETIFFSLLILITFTDLETYLIPDIYSIGGTLLGLLLSGVNPIVTWRESLLGAIVGGTILFLISFVYFRLRGREGLGGGDVKLMVMIGAFTGYKGVVVTMFVSAITGLMAGIIVMVRKKEGLSTMIPYGPFLALGAFVAYLWADKLMEIYISFVFS